MVLEQQNIILLLKINYFESIYLDIFRLKHELGASPSQISTNLMRSGLSSADSPAFFTLGRRVSITVCEGSQEIDV